MIVTLVASGGGAGGLAMTSLDGAEEGGAGGRPPEGGGGLVICRVAGALERVDPPEPRFEADVGADEGSGAAAGSRRP